jgi:transcriptional regulator with GAF, ATPase, and Fis domain
MKRRYLIIAPQTDAARQVTLERPVTQLGRSAEATLRLESKNVSSLHASIVVKDHAASLIDLDSTNGTQINGKRVSSAELHDGDRVELADVTVIYREEDVAEPRPAGSPRTETYSPLEAGGKRIRELLQQLTGAGTLGAEEAGALADSWDGLCASNRRLDALYAVLRNALSISDRSELITTLLAEVGRLLTLDVLGLYLREDNLFYVMEGGRLTSEERTQTLSATVLERVMTSGAPVLLENIGTDASVLGFESLMQFRIQSVLCLPVNGRDRAVFGALYCVSRRSGELTLLEKDRTFLGACSALVAVALENLALAAQARQRVRAEERSVQERRFAPVISRLRQERENLSLKLRDERPVELFGLDQPGLAAVREFSLKAARTDLPVLLTGETGVGKTVLARYIHEQGRASAPFVTVDCTTISEELLESELFGHEKGAFTGAYVRKSGKVAAAGNGTLFVDEIGDLPARLQGKLLRLLESGEYEPVGSSRTQRSAARLICATNKELRREVESRLFREDLYFRLNVLCFTLPPLRQVPQLVLPFAEHFLRVYAARVGATVTGFSAAARQALADHGWPGNVRELENAVLRALAQVREGQVDASDLELVEHSTGQPPVATPASSAPAQDDLDLHQARERLDRVYMRAALDQCEGNVTQAAKKLNVSRNSLMDLMKKYGIPQ